MSDSVWSHRQQPTRLPYPWDSPGKNTGVGYHFLLQCMKVKSESEVAQSCPTLSHPIDCSLPGSSIHGIFQAKVLGWVNRGQNSSSELLWSIMFAPRSTQWGRRTPKNVTNTTWKFHRCRMFNVLSKQVVIVWDICSQNKVIIWSKTCAFWSLEE